MRPSVLQPETGPLARPLPEEMRCGPSPRHLPDHDMITCLHCGNAFSSTESVTPVASISGSIMGDECTDSYYLCDRCGYYTVEVTREPFLGEDVVSFRGPVPRSKGDEAVALIGQCSEPWDKKCRCEAHRLYFGEWLD